MKWSPVQSLFKSDAEEAPRAQRVPPVPLRRQEPNITDIIVGSVIRFSESCPMPELRGKRAQVQNIRNYHFGDDVIASFRLKIGQNLAFSFSVAEDAQGKFLAISRQLSSMEQDHWFGRDALSFFTEPSTAKTLRCKADLQNEGSWAAERYVKSVDWVEGHLSDGRAQTPFRYNLLLSDDGAKALEVEHYVMIEKNKIYVTVYRPMRDIAEILDPAEVPEQPVSNPSTGPKLTITEPTPKVAARVPLNGHAPVVEDEDFFDAPAVEARPQAKEEMPLPPQFVAAYPSVMQYANAAVKPKPDFRRSTDPSEDIHITPTRHAAQPAMAEQEAAPLPSFLLAREHNYLSFDAVIPPETERVRCGLLAAKHLIDTALTRGVRVRDVMRDMVGLDSMMAEEVVFEMPLSDQDYRKLAMRYKMRPDHRDEIRARLQRELRSKLLGESE